MSQAFFSAVRAFLPQGAVSDRVKGLNIDCQGLFAENFLCHLSASLFRPWSAKIKLMPVFIVAGWLVDYCRFIFTMQIFKDGQIPNLDPVLGENCNPLRMFQFYGRFRAIHIFNIKKDAMMYSIQFCFVHSFLGGLGTFLPLLIMSNVTVYPYIKFSPFSKL